MIQQRTLKHVKVSQLGCCCWFITIELLSENCKLWWQILKYHFSLLKLVRHQVGYVTDSSAYSVSWSRRMWVFPSSVLSTGVGYIRASIIVCLPNDTTRYFGLVVFCSGVAGLRSALEIFKNSSIAIITKTGAYQRSTNCTRGGNNDVPHPCRKSYARIKIQRWRGLSAWWQGWQGKFSNHNGCNRCFLIWAYET